MSPTVATVVYGCLIVALVLLDRDRESRVSTALWIPGAWISICASRMVSQWLAAAPAVESPDQYVEGNALDRLVLTGLLAAGLIVLLARRQRSASLLRANWPIVLFFLYFGISVLWSDYPD